MRHAHSYGFFLNSTQFRTAALLRLPLGSDLRPAHKLMHTVYLLAARHSDSNEMKRLEAIFLERALRNTPIVSTTSPKNILHIIQAEVLLANYFFDQDQIAQGRVHQHIARSICVSYGLHKIRSVSQPEHGIYMPFMREYSTGLPPPESAIDEGERINAFWAVYILDRCWGAVLSYSIVDGLSDEAIDTPWPLDMWQYEQVTFVPTQYYIRHKMTIYSSRSSMIQHCAVIRLHFMYRLKTIVHL
jgi:hypothetical protein